MMRVLCVLLALAACARGLDNGLGRLPGLGWNSDYCVNCSKSANGFQNEAFIKHIADFIHGAVLPNGKTLQQLGYHYVNMDASWDLPDRDAHGNLVPDPAQWPSGLNATVDYVHSLNLGFGLYGDRGTKDCAGNPGAQGYERQDALFLANNHIDWYKEDSCNAPQDVDTSIKQYQTMRDALNATGRPIWFALCGWYPYYASDPRGGNNLGNSARVGPDTGQGWGAIMTNIEAGLSVTQYAGPANSGGYWNDGCLQLTPGFLNNGQPQDAAHNITNVRHRTQFSTWCMLAMNILMTGNLSALNPYVIETWSNAEVLAIQQDPLGHAGFLLEKLPPSNATAQRSKSSDTHRNSNYNSNNNNGLLGITPAGIAECGGEPSQQEWLFDTPAKQFLYNPASKQCLNVDDCATQVIYDSCTTTGPSCGGGQGSYHPNEEWALTPQGQVRSQLPGSPCLTLTSENAVVVAPCETPVPVAQKWTYDNATKNLVNGDGNCLTGPASTPSTYDSLIIGRRLAQGNFALEFLNNEYVNRNMTCDPGCMANLGLTAGASYTVRDLWLHETVATGVTAASGFSSLVLAGGASNLYQLYPA